MAKGRPEWWTKEFFLEEFEGSGDTCRRVIDNLAGRNDCRVTANTLYSDTQKWRRRDAEFRSRYDKVMEERYPSNGQRGVKRSPKSNAKLSTPEQYRKFLELLVSLEYNTNLACEQFGVRPGHVMRKLNPNSPHYDEEFAALWEETEAGWIFDVIAQTRRNAMEGGPVGLGSDPAQKLLLTNRAAHLFPERRRMEIKEEREVTVEIGTRLLAAVQERSRALFGPAEQGVIDIKNVEEVTVEPGRRLRGAAGEQREDHAESS